MSGYTQGVHFEGPDKLVIEGHGEIEFKTGSTLDFGSGAFRITRGQHTTIAASDTVVTGLSSVVAIVATLDDDPVAGCQFVTASRGNQAGAPAAGSVYIKTWKATAADDTALIAATTFSKKVNWIAIGS